MSKTKEACRTTQGHVAATADVFADSIPTFELFSNGSDTCGVEPSSHLSVITRDDNVRIKLSLEIILKLEANRTCPPYAHLTPDGHKRHCKSSNFVFCPKNWITDFRDNF